MWENKRWITNARQGERIREKKNSQLMGISGEDLEQIISPEMCGEKFGLITQH